MHINIYLYTKIVTNVDVMGFTCQICLSQSAVYILNHYSPTLSRQWRVIVVDLNV